MIRNTLLIKLKEPNTETIEKTKSVLLSMKSQIPVLQGIEVQGDILHGESSYDILLVTRFESVEDMETYLVHPVHVEVSSYIAGVIEKGASVCYEE